MSVTAELKIEHDAPIPTWFGIGGRADRLARPSSVEELARCVEIDPDLRVLGDGANLLVDDAGVRELVVSLTHPGFTGVRRDEETGRTIAGAGASLPKLITQAVREGLAGIEGLGGIPATVGGAAIMNAGGAYGQISDVVAKVHVVDRVGRVHVLDRSRIDYSYRHSGLNHLIITAVELDLKPADPEALRERLKEVMAYKKGTQPLAENSAGCAFKNPTLARAIDGIADAGQRVSAGMLLDRAGCKGMKVGGAQISDWHANFFVTREGALAHEVIELMKLAAARVKDKFGVELQREVVVWER